MVSPEQLQELLKQILKELRRKKKYLNFSRFRSLFFILQIIGIKVSTSLDKGWAGLWEKLVKQHSNLDWNYMENLVNGKLLVDLEIGIHPPEDRNMIGF